MKLYHGSNIEINEIDYSKSKPFKDFGKGFYLSDVFQQALDMASSKADILGGNPIVSTFEFDIEGMEQSTLAIKKFNGYTLDWAEFIIANRLGKPVKKYDYVYGPIADDYIGYQLRRWNDGIIDISTLMKEIQYAKGITFQHFFGTERALEFLKRI